MCFCGCGIVRVNVGFGGFFCGCGCVGVGGFKIIFGILFWVWIFGEVVWVGFGEGIIVVFVNKDVFKLILIFGICFFELVLLIVGVRVGVEFYCGLLGFFFVGIWVNGFEIWRLGNMLVFLLFGDFFIFVNLELFFFRFLYFFCWIYLVRKISLIFSSIMVMYFIIILIIWLVFKVGWGFEVMGGVVGVVEGLVGMNVLFGLLVVVIGGCVWEVKVDVVFVVVDVVVLVIDFVGDGVGIIRFFVLVGWIKVVVRVLCVFGVVFDMFIYML